MLHIIKPSFGTSLKVFEFEKMCQNHIYKVLKWQKLGSNLHTKKHLIFQNIETKTFDKTKKSTQHWTTSQLLFWKMKHSYIEVSHLLSYHT
jgi:hypothetical protein